MPKRCSIPDCRTSQKQGLMLLCYPKDPWRRSAWLKAVRNRGYEPTNNRLICELHFGPDQWEKLRVDGTKKLKWSGVPDVLDLKETEAARLLFQAGGADRSRQPESHELSPAPSTEIKTECSRDVPPTVTRKALKLDSISVENCPTILSSAANHLESEAQPVCIAKTEPRSVCSSGLGLKKISNNPTALLPSSGSNHMANVTRSSATNVTETSCIFPPGIGVKASTKGAAALVPLSTTNGTTDIATCISISVAESSSALSSRSLEVRANTNPPANFIESCLPLSSPGHSLVVRLPKSRFQNSLIEDLEDVRSFLNENERLYEERLISAVTALVKKHELLDQKLKWVEGVVQENSSLQAKVLDHQKTLLENHKLKEKLHSYEKRTIVDNTMFRKTSSCNGSPFITMQGMQSTQQGRVCHITLPEGAFASLDDQL